PPSMEQALAGGEIVEQQVESQEVEHRTDRSDEEHEVTDDAQVPALWTIEIGAINVVARDRDLGQVVQEVVQQNLRRKHRQKRQEDRRRRHADRKSTRLNSSHGSISYAVFCLKKKRIGDARRLDWVAVNCLSRG